MAAPMRRFLVQCQTLLSKKTYFNAVASRSIFTFTTLRDLKQFYVAPVSSDQSHHGQERSSGVSSWTWVFGLAAAGVYHTSDKDEEKDSTKMSSDDKEIVQIIKHAKLAEMKSNFEEAEHFYHRALGTLVLYEQNKTWSQEQLLQARVYIYDCMANMALALQQFQKAETLFKETMRGLLQQGFNKTDNAVVEISLKLAMVYAMLNRLDEAEKGYKFCIDTQESKLQGEGDSDEDTEALLGLAVDSYSRFLMLQSKLPEALESMKKAMDIALKVFGENHPQIAVLYNDTATVLTMMNDFKSAKEHALKAVKIAQQTDPHDLPSFLCNIGAIYIHEKDLASAESSCKRALKLSDKSQNKLAQTQARKCLEEIKRKKAEKSE